MASTFQTVPTPNPNESSFILTVDDKDLGPTNMPVDGTTYAAWTWGQKDRIDEAWSDYTYRISVDAAPGKRAFLFVKNKTATEANVPFDTYWTTKSYRWPMVIHSLAFGENIITGTATRDRTAVQAFERITPAMEVVCDVKVELFLSPIPFTRQALQHKQMVTNDLSISHKGFNFSYRDVLHPTIRYYFGSNGMSIQSEYGTFNAAVDFSDTDMIIPGTSFEDWAPHVISDTQEPTKGLFLREKQTIFPPRVRPPTAGRA